MRLIIESRRREGMRFIHLSDLHLGKSVCGISMLADQRYILDEILKICREQKADAVLIAGDVYDMAQPSEGAVGLWDYFLTELAKQDTAVLAISGNHDSDIRLGFGSRLFRAHEIHIAGEYRGDVPCVTLDDDHGKVNFWLLPFVKASRVRFYHEELDTSSYDAAIRSALSVCDIDTSQRNVILSHQFVTSGTAMPDASGAETVAPEFVGTVERVDASAFDMFDYAALGHIHRPQRICRDTVRYCGSPLKYSLSEIGQNKGAVLVTMGEKGDVRVEVIPLRPPHEMRRIKGKLRDVIAPENVVYPDDYVYVTLTDEVIIPDAMSVIKGSYPSAVHMDYENSHTRAIESFTFAEVTRKKSFEELMGDFYRQLMGTEPTEEEWKLLKEAAKEGGIIDEAD